MNSWLTIIRNQHQQHPIQDAQSRKYDADAALMKPAESLPVVEHTSESERSEEQTGYNGHDSSSVDFGAEAALTCEEEDAST